MEKFKCRDCGKKFYTPGDVPRKCAWCSGDVDPVGEPETATATLMSIKDARLSDVLGFVPTLEKWQGLVEQNKNLTSKIYYLLFHYIELEEGVFTFPDGDTWDLLRPPSPYTSKQL